MSRDDRDPGPGTDVADLLIVARADIDTRCLYEETFFEVLAWAPLRDGVADLGAFALAAPPAHRQRIAELAH